MWGVMCRAGLGLNSKVFEAYGCWGSYHNWPPFNQCGGTHMQPPHARLSLTNVSYRYRFQEPPRVQLMAFKNLVK